MLKKEVAHGPCGRVLVMDKGRVFADGPRDVVLGDRELLRAHRLEQPLRMVLEEKVLRDA